VHGTKFASTQSFYSRFRVKHGMTEFKWIYYDVTFVKRTPMKTTLKRTITTFLSLSLFAFTFAQPARLVAALPTGYNKPADDILRVLHAPSPPQPYISPTRDNLVLVTWEEYPSIARLSIPFLKLAGVRVETQNRSRHDTPGGYGIVACAKNYVITRISDGSQVAVSLPEKACASGPLWSADGKRFAFSNRTSDANELWIADAQDGSIRQIKDVRLNSMLGTTAQWMPDQRTLLVKLVPINFGPAPDRPLVPSGPGIQESKGEKGQSSTYEARDTLKNKFDEDLFDYYATSQLALVDVTTGSVKRIGQPAIFDNLSPAPGGEFILVSFIQKPYSYVTAYNRFPYDVELWNKEGKAVKRLASLPLADRVPIHGVPTGPRDFAWRVTEPATLIWSEALDGGDWNVQVPHRDKVMMLSAPFRQNAEEIFRTQQRFAGIYWGEKTDFALMQEYDENRHWERTFIINPDDLKQKPEVLWDLSSDERYADPGAPVTRTLPNGAVVVRQDRNAIFLSGDGASSDGDRPFLDKLDIKTKTTERLFRSSKSGVERFVAFTKEEANELLTWSQSPSDPPNAFVRTLGEAISDAASGEARYASTAQALTHIPDPTPEIRAIKKRLVTYKRKDGVDLSFTIYTPPNYKEGTRVPTILYAYPLDFAQSSTAGQVTGSQMTFTRLKLYQLLLLAGYAIIDRASFPIVGDPKTAYDTYLEQLVANAQAAVDKAVELGIADRDRIGVTGHSHGALMTVNLLAHSNLFKAGVATSGAYNKILTPFGFQSERRSVWEAPEVYKKASPFFFADKFKTPLVLIHGEDDANPGTTPLQTRLLYEAIRGNGGTVRQVMLPYEPHWYTAMESNEQLIYEMVRWFDLYVKNANR
jgi:dipeptidyl aminopeptidase/acylaminoacyl peptidase